MTISIDGTNGISGVDGSAATPALQGTDTNTGISFGTDEVNIVTGGTTRATVDSSGRVGIGTTSPATVLDLEASADAYVTIQPGTTDGNAGLLINNSAGTQKGVILYDTDDNYMLFSTDNTEAMRINNAGSILVNTTSGGPGGASVTGRVAILFNPSTHGGLVISSNSGAGTLQQFTNTASGVVGSITTNGTSTAFNTSSDYRLKENIQYLDGAIDRLKQLPVHRFNFIANADVTVDGFLAHEVQAVIPEAVTGTKDEVGKEGNPIYQGIDQSKLVPLLTAALQEAIAKIETLETANASQAATIAALDARLTALEGGAS